MDFWEISGWKEEEKRGFGDMGLLQDGMRGGRRGGTTGMQGDSEEPDSRSSSGSAVNKKQAAVGAALANVNTFTIPNDSG